MPPPDNAPRVSRSMQETPRAISAAGRDQTAALVQTTHRHSAATRPRHKFHPSYASAPRILRPLSVLAFDTTPAKPRIVRRAIWRSVPATGPMSPEKRGRQFQPLAIPQPWRVLTPLVSPPT